MSENAHKGHRQRVKNRYMNDGGLDSFEDHQVLELLLFYCYPQRDTNEIAHKMIQCYGSLHNLFDADPLDISRRCNVSENVAILISLIPHLSKRYSTGKYVKRNVLSSSKLAGEYCIGLFTGIKYECFYLLCLNTQRQLLHAELVHKGTIDSAPVYPRIIVETALKHNAASVILAHNHPSGKLVASHSDIDVTRKLISALGVIDIDVVDHIIVGGGSYYSFSEKKLLHLVY